MQARLRQLVRAHTAYTVELRRRLHGIPEPGLREYRTSKLIAAELDRLGLAVRTDVFDTAVVADLTADRPGGYVALRADMDALPVEETTPAAYRSSHPGYSHCCGHDGNMAALVGAARVLVDLGEQRVGHVRFIFQPAEELGVGAKALLEAGVFADGLPQAIFSLHAWPDLPVGTVASKPGPIMAASDAFTVTIIGRGGHGARPERAKNPLLGMARVIGSLSSMDTDQRRVSLCLARAGERSNVIADTGVLLGTLRTLDGVIRASTIDEIQSKVIEACAEVGLRGEVHFGKSCPVVSINEALYEIFRQVASDLLGPDKVVRIDRPSMGSEDFGFFLQHVPGLLFRVGMGPGGAELHNSNFDFNDEALPAAMLMLTGLALRVCKEGFQAR